MFKRKKRGYKPKINKDQKFCPVCGKTLEIQDTYCVRCGYSFEERRKRKGKKIKLKNIIFLIIILIIVYVSIRFFNGQSIIPTSIPDALNFSIGQFK